MRCALWMLAMLVTASVRFFEMFVPLFFVVTLVESEIILSLAPWPEGVQWKHHISPRSKPQ